MPPRSDIWKYFIKKSNGGKCKFCQMEVKNKGNTTNLRNHLIRKHGHKKGDMFLSNNGNPPEPDHGNHESSQLLNNDEIHEIADADPQEMENPESETNSIVAPATSSTMSSSTSTSSSLSSIKTCFDNIKAFKAGGFKDGRVTNALLFLIAKDNLPLDTVHKEGFNYFMKIVLPMYKIPSRPTVTNLIDEKYSILALNMKKNIEKAKYVSLSTDIWTDVLNTRSYLGVTCHFVFDDNLKSVSIGVFELTERHTSQYIGTKLLEICEEWKIPQEKVAAVVTDNGANIKRAVIDSFGNCKHLACFAHSLNLVASKPFEDGFSEIKELITAVKEIVTFFKHSVGAADELRILFGDEEVALKLIQSVCTRWNSVYYQLERFYKLSDKISSILLRNPKAPSMLSAIQLNTVYTLIKIMKPFETITREVSGQKYVTVSKVIPMIFCLRKEVHAVQTNCPIGENVKKIVLEEISKRFGLVEQVSVLAVATILDPRFKKIYFEDPLACGHGVSKISSYIAHEKRLMEMDKDSTSVSVESNGNNIEDLGVEENIWKHHQKLVDEHHKYRRDENATSTEFSFYLNQNLIGLEENPIKYWNKQNYTHLQNIAIRHLSITATSVPSERLFSQAGNILSHKRSRLTPERLNKLIFLNCLEKED